MTRWTVYRCFHDCRILPAGRCCGFIGDDLKSAERAEQMAPSSKRSQEGSVQRLGSHLPFSST